MAALSTIAIAGGVAVAAGTTGKIIAGGKAARAADKAGQAKISAAKEQIAAQTRERRRIEQAASQAAAPSQEELDQISALVKTSEDGLARAADLVEREAEVLDDIDPVIQQSAQNITALLRGEQATVLKPLRDQRRRQRARLEQDLRGRLGPGFRTSSAGIAALDQFESSNDLIFANAQQQALSNVTQTLQGGTGARANIVNQTTAAFSPFIQAQMGALQGRQAIADRRTRAVTGAAAAAPINFGALSNVAGSQFAGDAIRAETFGQVAGDVSDLGASALSFGLAKPSGAKKPTTSFGDISAGRFSGATGQANSLFSLSQSR